MCFKDSDCPPNPAASCTMTCTDGSNPCGNVCKSGECERRGCPNDKTCSVDADCGTNPAASCAMTCTDGSNPCDFACTHGVCRSRGCPL